MGDLCVAAAAFSPRSDDELLAFLLVSTWSLLTGRTLRDAPPDDLTVEELIEFWADDFPGAGRAAGAGGSGERSAGAGR